MQSRAPAEPTVTEFETIVDRVEGRTVVLEETYFYPEGGGQPADRGVIESSPVEDIQTVDEEVHHELASDPECSAGESVSCAVDAQFRQYLMRAHTASHALYGAGRRLLDDLGYGGFGITEQKVRVDFETSTEIDDTTLVELERSSTASSGSPATSPGEQSPGKRRSRTTMSPSIRRQRRGSPARRSDSSRSKTGTWPLAAGPTSRRQTRLPVSGF
jgi:alanyl-tRNA synthetase